MGNQSNLRCVRRLNRSRQRAKHLAFRSNKVRSVIQLSSRHTYIQLLNRDGSVLMRVGTTDKDIRSKLKYGGNKEAAKFIGQWLASRALKKGIKVIVFDRSGFKYHGRVAALASSMREEGMEF